MELPGQRIKECRLKSGLSVDQIAEMLGKNRATIYRYENGFIDDVPVSVISRISDILRVPPAYLMGISDNPYYETTPEYERLSEEDREILDLYHSADPIFQLEAIEMLRRHPKQA